MSRERGSDRWVLTRTTTARVAYASAAAAVLGLVTFVGLLVVGAPFGLLTDTSGALLGLTVLPLAWALRSRIGPSSVVVGATIAGLVGGAALAVASGGLVLAGLGLRIDPATLEVAAVYANGLVGAWLLLASAVGFTTGQLDRRLGVAGLVGGGGYVLLAVGFLLGGVTHPLAGLGGLLGVVGYVAWAVLFGRSFGAVIGEPNAEPIGG